MFAFSSVSCSANICPLHTMVDRLTHSCGMCTFKNNLHLGVAYPTTNKQTLIKLIFFKPDYLSASSIVIIIFTATLLVDRLEDDKRLCKISAHLKVHLSRAPHQGRSDPSTPQLNINAKYINMQYILSKSQLLSTGCIEG